MRANEFIDYQNPYMFLEFPPKGAREQYDNHKALYPSLNDLEEGVTQEIQKNKKVKGLKFKLWFNEMNQKFSDRIKKKNE